MDIEKLIVRVFISTYLALERAVETAQYFETKAHALFREVQPAHGAARVTAPTSEAYPCLLDRGKYVAVVVVIVVVALPIFLDGIFTVGLSMTGQGNVFVWGNDQTTRLLLTRSSEASPCTKCFSCFFALVYYIHTSYIWFTILSPSLVFSPSVLLSQLINGCRCPRRSRSSCVAFISHTHTFSLFLFHARFSIYLLRSVSLPHWCGIHFLQGRSQQ